MKFKINRDSFANLTANSPRLLASNNAPDLIRLPTIGDTVKNKLLLNLTHTSRHTAGTSGLQLSFQVYALTPRMFVVQETFTN